MIVAVCPKCGADLEALTYTTYPPIHAYRCRNCGWTQEERTNITRVPIATVERKPITNYDLLTHMSVEELAIELAESGCPKIHFTKDDEFVDCPADRDPNRGDCVKCWFTYLKQEADHV